MIDKHKSVSICFVNKKQINSEVAVLGIFLIILYLTVYCQYRLSLHLLLIHIDNFNEKHLFCRLVINDDYASLYHDLRTLVSLAKLSSNNWYLQLQ